MIEYVGDIELLKRRKTAFFAPGKMSVASVMPSCDWATAMARSGECVISGFASRLESDVWNFLERGTQPIIVALTRSKFKVTPAKYRPLLAAGRLLIIFLGYGSRPCREYAARRNEYVASIADSLVFASIHPDSALYPLFKRYRHKSVLLTPQVGARFIASAPADGIS